MPCSKVFVKVFLICVLFGCLTYGRSTEGKLKRSRRQAGDARVAEYLARLALERNPAGCDQIGCGLIDIIQSGKKRSQTNNNDLSETTKAKLLSVLLTDSANQK